MVYHNPVSEGFPEQKQWIAESADPGYVLPWFPWSLWEKTKVTFLCVCGGAHLNSILRPAGRDTKNPPIYIALQSKTTDTGAFVWKFKVERKVEGVY